MVMRGPAKGSSGYHPQRPAPGRQAGHLLPSLVFATLRLQRCCSSTLAHAPDHIHVNPGGLQQPRLSHGRLQGALGQGPSCPLLPVPSQWLRYMVRFACTTRGARCQAALGHLDNWDGLVPSNQAVVSSRSCLALSCTKGRADKELLLSSEAAPPLCVVGERLRI